MSRLGHHTLCSRDALGQARRQYANIAAALLPPHAAAGLHCADTHHSKERGCHAARFRTFSAPRALLLRPRLARAGAGPAGRVRWIGAPDARRTWQAPGTRPGGARPGGQRGLADGTAAHTPHTAPACCGPHQRQRQRHALAHPCSAAASRLACACSTSCCWAMLGSSAIISASTSGRPRSSGATTATYSEACTCPLWKAAARLRNSPSSASLSVACAARRPASTPPGEGP